MAEHNAATTTTDPAARRGMALSEARGHFGLQVPRDRNLPAGVFWMVAEPGPEQRAYEFDCGRVWQSMVPPSNTVKLSLNSCMQAELEAVLFALAGVAAEGNMELAHYHYVLDPDAPDPRQFKLEWEVRYRVEPGTVMRWNEGTWQVLRP